MLYVLEVMVGWAALGHTAGDVHLEVSSQWMMVPSY